MPAPYSSRRWVCWECSAKDHRNVYAECSFVVVASTEKYYIIFSQDILKFVGIVKDALPYQQSSTLSVSNQKGGFL